MRQAADAVRLDTTALDADAAFAAAMAVIRGRLARMTPTGARPGAPSGAARRPLPLRSDMKLPRSAVALLYPWLRETLGQFSRLRPDGRVGTCAPGG